MNHHTGYTAPVKPIPPSVEIARVAWDRACLTNLPDDWNAASNAMDRVASCGIDSAWFSLMAAIARGWSDA